jgi:type I restriction enzyme S subunit
MLQLLAEKPQNGVSPEAFAEPPGTPTFSIAAIRDGRVNLQGNEHLKYVRVPDEVEERYALRKGDVLIVRGNANPALVGKAGMVRVVPDHCVFPDITKRVVFKTYGESRVSPEFAVLAWNHSVVHNQVLRRAKTSNGTLKINNRDVQQIAMPVPPRTEQALLVDLVGAADSQVDALSVVTDDLVRLKRALSHDLLTGKVRVRPPALAAAGAQ